MTGRPSTFSEATFAEIIEKVSSGTPLAQVCREEGMPALSTFYGWLEKSDALSVRFARAREAGYDMIAADCLQIIDDGGNNPLHAAKRAEIRLKLLAKWSSRYADNVQVRHADHEGKSLRDMSETEAAARVAAILEAGRRRALAALPPPSADDDETGDV